MNQKKTPLWKRMIPIVFILALVVAVYLTGLHRYLSFEQLRDNRLYLLNLVEEWGFLSVIGFIFIYILATALSIPGAIYLTITAGFLFGEYLGTFTTVTGATIGATIIFAAIKMGFGSSLKSSASGFVDKMKDGFSKNSFSYLMVLRILPVFPFWLVNIVPALLDVKMKTFFIATFFGIIPGSFVYNSIGSGLGAIFDSGETPDLSIIYKKEILIPLIGLAILSLLPIFKDKIFRLFGLDKTKS